MKPRVLITLITLVLLVGIDRLSAVAMTYAVAPHGNDANPGTPAAPFRTITHGTSVLRAGDTLRLSGGTYRESVSWATAPRGSSWTTPVTIESAPGEMVIWEVPPGQSTALNVLDVSYIIVRGMIFDGTQGSNNLVQAKYTSLPVSGAQSLVSLNCLNGDPGRCAHHIRFEQNEFRSAAYGMASASQYADALEFMKNEVHHIGKVENCNVNYIGAPNTIFDGNRFEAIGCTAIAFWQQDASTVHNPIVRNNRFTGIGRMWAPDNGSRECCAVNPAGCPGSTDCGARMPVGFVNIKGGAIFISRGQGAQVYNNVIAESVGGIYAGHNVSQCLIAYNTIVGNITPNGGFGDLNAGIVLDDQSGGANQCIVRNNLVYQPGITTPPPIANLGSGNTLSNNLTTDPRFVNPATQDFHLQAGSPAIDAGAAMPTITRDAAGGARDQGGVPDLGAYEYGSAGASRLPTPTKFRLIP